MAFSLLWSLGFIISIVVFSILIGLSFYFNGSSKKALAKFAVISLIGISIMIYLLCMFKNQIGSFVGAYNYSILFLIAFILIFIGYLMSRENNFKNSFKKVLLLSYLCFTLMSLVCILSKTELLALGDLQISLFTTILFNLLIIITYFAFNKFNIFDNSFKLLKDFYFILGAYFLIVALFIPNIVSLSMDDMKPINIVSIESITVTLVFIIVVVVLGLWYSRNNTLLK